MESVIARAIQRNNEAVDLMFLEGQATCSISSDFLVFRECLSLVKESLVRCQTNSTEKDAAQSSASNACPGWHPPAYPLVDPSSKSLGPAETTELFSYRRPLYFSSRFLSEQGTSTTNYVDPSLVRFVSSVVMFNMGLCFQYSSFISTATTSDTGTKQRWCKSLGKAQIFYQSVARLLRDGFPLGIATELELLSLNNLLQVSAEIGDVGKAQEAAGALHNLLTCMQWGPGTGLAAWSELIDQSSSQLILGNLLWWQLMTTSATAVSSSSSPLGEELRSSSSPGTTKKASIVLSTCAPAA